MKKIILPITRAKEVYKVEPESGSILFDPMSIVGNSEKTSLRPNDWMYINNIDSAKTTVYQNGNGGSFVDIHRLNHDPSLAPHKNYLINLALENGLLLDTRHYVVSWRDGDIDYGSTYHRDFNEALNAANGTEEYITAKDGIIGTSKLAEKIGVSEQLLMTNPEIYGLIGAIQEFSEGGLNIDGIFWSEEYESKENMSEIMAIFPHKAEKWVARLVNTPATDMELLSQKTETSHQMLELPGKNRNVTKTADFAAGM